MTSHATARAAFGLAVTARANGRTTACISAARFASSRMIDRMPRMNRPLFSVRSGLKLSNENRQNWTCTPASAASASAASTSATAVPPRPVGVPPASSATPSPRKSGNTHQRIVSTPFARMSRSSPRTRALRDTPGAHQCEIPPKSPANWSHAKLIPYWNRVAQPTATPPAKSQLAAQLRPPASGPAPPTSIAGASADASAGHALMTAPVSPVPASCVL